jgi:hypothetical protein
MSDRPKLSRRRSSFRRRKSAGYRRGRAFLAPSGDSFQQLLAVATVHWTMNYDLIGLPFDLDVHLECGR